MNTTIANFINNILLEGLYLSLWVCFLAINIYRQQILIKEIDSLKKKQDILFESLTNEATMEQIWFSIGEFGRILYSLEEIND